MSTSGQRGGPHPTELRLPGSVAEIMASPPGPTIGAFFDLDGTLVAGFTAAASPRSAACAAGTWASVELLRHGAGRGFDRLGRIEFEDLIEGRRRAGGTAGRGRRGDRRAAVRPADRGDRIYPEMRELVRAHRPAATPWC